MELEYPSAVVEQLHSQLHFARFTQAWNYHAEIPAQLLAELPSARSEAQLQCLVCGATGHAVSRCPSVTGLKGSRDTSRTVTQKRICYEWVRTGRCSKGSACRYDHPKGGAPRDPGSWKRMFVVRRMFGAIRFGECSALVGEGHFDSGK
eukprot:SAG31_NODE_6153_length_2146_cov_47.561798_4_plen_148_part_01